MINWNRGWIGRFWYVPSSSEVYRLGSGVARMVVYNNINLDAIADCFQTDYDFTKMSPRLSLPMISCHDSRNWTQRWLSIRNSTRINGILVNEKFPRLCSNSESLNNFFHFVWISSLSKPAKQQTSLRLYIPQRIMIYKTVRYTMASLQIF